jgi:Arc/MetJ family transcription regulator
MRTTVDIDDELMAAALRATGERTKTAVIEAGLRALVERERLLRALDETGGSYPSAKAAPRRRAG